MLFYCYLFGITIEFIKTTQQLFTLEEQTGFLTNELKLSKIQLFITIFIISLIWLPYELYAYCIINGIEFKHEKNYK